MKCEARLSKFLADRLFRIIRNILLILAVVLMVDGNPEAAQPTIAPQENHTTHRLSTMDDLVEQAVAANPRIEKARQNWRSAIETYRTAVGLPAPQLMVQFGSTNTELIPPFTSQ